MKKDACSMLSLGVPSDWQREKHKERSIMTTSALSMSNARLLLRELTHRINNEFASVIQTLSFKVARSSDRDVKAALGGVMEQLHNYARVHHALQMPATDNGVDAPAYLRSLCDSISRSKLKNGNIELVLLDVPFQMSSERCWMMGMIVAELITNAIRHAFGEQGGTIEVECRPSGVFVECRVSDNGSASSAEVRRGSGLKIIEALAQELGASFHFNFGEDGSEAILIIPIEPDGCEERVPFRRLPEGATNFTPVAEPEQRISVNKSTTLQSRVRKDS
jgi:two-component sensor histidine kinase